MRFRNLLSCLLCAVVPTLYSQDAANPTSAQTTAEEAAQAQTDLRRQVHSQQAVGGSPGQIPQRLAHESGDIHLHDRLSPPMVIRVPDPLVNLMVLTCQSDLVVIGKVESGTSYPTVDEGYIYTDWDLSVEEAIKNNAKSSVREGQTIVVTQPGGTLEINGRRVYTLSDDREFHTGNEVLLYLRYLPSTGTYALRSWMPPGFILSDSKIINLNRTGYIQSETTDKTGLLDLARQAANLKCPEQKDAQIGSPNAIISPTWLKGQLLTMPPAGISTL